MAVGAGPTDDSGEPEPSDPDTGGGQELGDDDALAWLRVQPDGQVSITISALARQWGWNRTKVRRRLDRWAAEGHITRTIGPGGQTLIGTATPIKLPATIAAIDPPAVAEPDMALPDAPAEVAPPPIVQGGEQGERPVFRPWPSPVVVVQAVGSAGLAALAIAIAWFGIRINAWYGGTLGRTAEASELLTGLSVSADILAMMLPATGRAMWTMRRHAAAATAWLLWVITIAIALMATVGFAALNIADTTAARGKVVAESALLTARIGRLATERAGIGETRPVAALEAELQRVQPSANAVWRTTSGCRDITLPASGEACAGVLSVRSAIAAAQRRDALDAELREATAELARRPAVTTSDPQTEIAAQLVNWASFGMITLTPDDIHLARIAGMTLMPQLAGLVLLLAAALWPAGFAADRRP
jgi:hypothetical protein